jgi:SulP family sulfate permease
LSQLEQFKTVVNGEVFGYQVVLCFMLGLVALTIAIVVFLPKEPKLYQLIIVVLVGLGLGIETKTVADIASISGFSSFHIPDITLSFETLKIIFICSNYGFGRINRGITYYKLSR